VKGVGVVVIGRNEGERLRCCLLSLRECVVVYVDSGSEDGSVEAARSLGADVVELDLTKPFTAARARNTGFERLMCSDERLEFIQFVDGDCEVAPGWVAMGRQGLESSPDLAVVCGRQRERFPDASVYNRLMDMEWDTPIGEAEACTGNALIRVAAFRQVGGFRDSLIAGEEPELCLRLRAAGWRVRRLNAEMVLHDAAMYRFVQWWRRAVRAGHAFAECSCLHSNGPLRLWQREARSNWFWGLLLPLTALAPAYWTAGLTLLLLLGYPLLFGRVFYARRRRGDPTRFALLYSFFCVLGKFPQMLGQLRFCRGRMFRRPGRLIEYKGKGQ
jgi:GT2 family glycosyltransferase